MKNFYEATVTKSTLTLPIKLTLDPMGTLPCLIKINNTIVYEDIINKQQVITNLITLNSPIDINIQIHRHHPDAVKISLTIDEYNILPLYQQLADPPTCYLDSNNIWTFKISNFYSWYHEITGKGWII